MSPHTERNTKFSYAAHSMLSLGLLQQPPEPEEPLNLFSAWTLLVSRFWPVGTCSKDARDVREIVARRRLSTLASELLYFIPPFLAL
jgi:hypothetical protein